MKDRNADRVTSGHVTTARQEPVRSVRGPTKSRVMGVDVARGIALIGMMATHTFSEFNSNGTPTAATTVAAGRSATLFVMVAGISLAFMSGRRHPVQGRARTAAAAVVAVRALLVGVIGLTLGYVITEIDLILVSYAVFFLLAIPLLGLGPRVLACLAVTVALVGPLLLLLATFHLDLWEPDGNPTFGDLLIHPFGLALFLLAAGVFPAVVYMAYICAGLAIGRLDLSSTRVAAWLLGGGLVLAVTTWFTSSMLLFHWGGLEHLRDVAPPGSDWARTRNLVLWNPETVSSWDLDTASSWWWLALRAHHSSTPVDALQTLGAAMAVLGAALLLTRLPIAARLLRPVAITGSMTLTIYCAHLVIPETGLLGDHSLAQFILILGASVVFAVLWRRTRGQGPLEGLLAYAAGSVRRMIASPTETARDRPGGAG